MENNKSQNALEFMIIFFIILVVFLVIVLFLNQRVTEINKERYFDSLRDTALILESELDLAIKAENGYQRTFRLPERIMFQDYNVTFVNSTTLARNLSLFVFNYTETRILETDYFFFSSPNITGEIDITENITIIKNNNIICLNICN